jgi:hypothetical protein
VLFLISWLIIASISAFSGLYSLGLNPFSINNLIRQGPQSCDHSVTSADVRLSVGVEMFRIESRTRPNARARDPDHIGPVMGDRRPPRISKIDITFIIMYIISISDHYSGHYI